MYINIRYLIENSLSAGDMYNEEFTTSIASRNEV